MALHVTLMVLVLVSSFFFLGKRPRKRGERAREQSGKEEEEEEQGEDEADTVGCCSLRVEHPTQLHLQTEEHMEHGWREEERGRHCVFCCIYRLPSCYF